MAIRRVFSVMSLVFFLFILMKSMQFWLFPTQNRWEIKTYRNHTRQMKSDGNKINSISEKNLKFQYVLWVTKDIIIQ